METLERHESELKSILTSAQITGMAAGGSADALEKMKIRCFQTAADFLSKGQYHKALEQIKYVIEVEPGNKVARDFERRVVDLAMVDKKYQAVPPAPEPTPASEPVAVEPTPARREFLSKYMLALLVVAVAALSGGAGYFFAMKEKSEPVRVIHTLRAEPTTPSQK